MIYVLIFGISVFVLLLVALVFKWSGEIPDVSHLRGWTPVDHDALTSIVDELEPDTENLAMSVTLAEVLADMALGMDAEQIHAEFISALSDATTIAEMDRIQAMAFTTTIVGAVTAFTGTLVESNDA